MPRGNRGAAAAIYGNPLFGWNNPMQNNPAQEREAFITNMIARNISELAINRFKWEGFPESVDTRFIEVCLLWHGLSVVYWNEEYDKLLAVQGAPTGSMNFLQNPTSFTVLGPGNYGKPNPDDNTSAAFHQRVIGAYQPAMEYKEGKAKRKAIPIWANALRNSEWDIVNVYATRLGTVDRTLEINTKGARKSKVLITTREMQLSASNFARQLDEGTELITINNATMQDLEFIKAVDLGIEPDSYDKLSILRTRWWNECMGLLGIDNANQDKKERLVASEVSANDGQTDSMRYVSLNARRQAAEYINEVFDLNVTVDFNVEIEQRAKEMAAQQGIDSNSNSRDE